MNVFTKLQNHTSKRDRKHSRKSGMRVTGKSVFVIQAQITKRGIRSNEREA